MEMLIASLVNLAIDCMWTTIVTFGFGTARTTVVAASAESPLAAACNADLDAYAHGRITRGEFDARQAARNVLLGR